MLPYGSIQEKLAAIVAQQPRQSDSSSITPPPVNTEILPELPMPDHSHPSRIHEVLGRVKWSVLELLYQVRTFDVDAQGKWQ
jgi:hypothetical protein